MFAVVVLRGVLGSHICEDAPLAPGEAVAGADELLGSESEESNEELAAKGEVVDTPDWRDLAHLEPDDTDDDVILVDVAFAMDVPTDLVACPASSGVVDTPGMLKCAAAARAEIKGTASKETKTPVRFLVCLHICSLQEHPCLRSGKPRQRPGVEAKVVARVEAKVVAGVEARVEATLRGVGAGAEAVAAEGDELARLLRLCLHP